MIALLLAVLCASPLAQTPAPLHAQRFSMGTMFDVLVYHLVRTEAERGMALAMDEIARLDGVLSDFNADSDLSKLVRDGRRGFVTVDPSLYEVLQESVLVSRRSGGKFDVTIAPLLKVWKAAEANGRSATPAEVAEAQRCVGYDKIEMSPPDRVRLASDCLEIDLGAIGKGYAVERALATLRKAGIRNALVNAGSSSIGAIGAPPGRRGWPVDLKGSVSGSKVLLLRDSTISTSQQSPTGGIVDPKSGAPTESEVTVSVIAPTGAVSDALSTAVLLLPREQGMKLLEQYPGVSALWISAAGVTIGAYRESALELSDSR